MKLKSLLISSLMLLSAGTAWADVEINATNFPDENFRNYLLSQEYGSDGVLTAEEISEVTNIYVPYLGIKSLQGIDFFTSLGFLYCQGNQLTSFDLPKCASFVNLNCSGNKLTSLDLSNNTNLCSLICSSNQLTSLDVSVCPGLSVLECASNKIKSLDVSHNVELQTFSCEKNQLTSLDLSNNSKLQRLQCFSNQLTSLDVSGKKSLNNLQCGKNQLTTLDVSGCTALNSLSCNDNQLTKLDVSDNANLSELFCENNKLTTLDFSNNPYLYYLECYRNQLKGEGLDALIESLPTQGYTRWNLLYDLEDTNVITTTQVAVATAKGWQPKQYFNGYKWQPYEGVDPATGIAGIEADTDKNDSEPWYTINGVELTEKPTAPGIYIHGGKKVVVK